MKKKKKSLHFLWDFRVSMVRTDGRPSPTIIITRYTILYILVCRERGRWKKYPVLISVRHLIVRGIFVDGRFQNQITHWKREYFQTTLHVFLSPPSYAVRRKRIPTFRSRITLLYVIYSWNIRSKESLFSRGSAWKRCYIVATILLLTITGGHHAHYCRNIIIGRRRGVRYLTVHIFW